MSVRAPRTGAELALFIAIAVVANVAWLAFLVFIIVRVVQCAA